MWAASERTEQAYPAEAAPANARFVYQRMECYHCFWRCYKRTDKFQVFPCVGEIGEEKVWRECESLLATGAAAAAGEGADKEASAGQR